MAENHDHSKFIYNSYYYDGHRLDPSDLDLAAYIDARIAAAGGGGGAATSLVLTSPDLTQWAVTVNDEGVLITTQI